jgi:hypothetical protein
MSFGAFREAKPEDSPPESLQLRGGNQRCPPLPPPLPREPPPENPLERLALGALGTLDPLNPDEDATLELRKLGALETLLLRMLCAGLELARNDGADATLDGLPLA